MKTEADTGADDSESETQTKAGRRAKTQVAGTPDTDGEAQEEAESKPDTPQYNFTPGSDESLALDSPLAHFEKFLQIYDKDETLRKPRPNRLQRLIHEAVAKLISLNVPVRLLVTKIRQSGGTTFSLHEGYHAGRRRRLQGVVIADVARNSSKMLSRLEDYRANDKFRWQNEMKTGMQKISCDNGTVWEIDSAQNWNAGISRTRQFFLASETPKWPRSGAKNDRRIMGAVLPSIPKRAGTIVISEGTPNGASGWQYDQWKGALTLPEFEAELNRGIAQPGNGWVKVFAGWWEFEENKILNLSAHERERIQGSMNMRELEGIKRFKWNIEQIAWRRATMDAECGGSEEVFDEYYPQDDVSCWLSSGRARFNQSTIARLLQRARGVQPETGFLTLQDDGEMICWSASPEGAGDIQVWERPREGCRYLVFCDPATGRDQTKTKNPDRHSIGVWRAPYLDEFGNERKAKLVARVRPPFQGESDLATAHIDHLSRFYGRAIVVLEMNMGLGILELLKTRGVPLYKREVMDERDRSTPLVQYGFKLEDRQMKRTLIDCLAIHLREDQIEVECPHWLHEARVFMIDDDGSECAPSGEHDDDVMGSAMALYTIGNATLYHTPRRTRKPPKDLKNWKAAIARR